MATARGKKKGSARDSNRTTRSAPAKREALREYPTVDELPKFPTMPPDMTEPLDLDQLDEILRNHTFQLERCTRDLPELQRLEGEVKETRERIKHRIYGKLRDATTVENKALLKRFAKPTEAIYSAEVELDADWIGTQNVLRAIRERLAEIGRIQTLFEHRRTVVRGLIELYASEYWGISDRTERARVGRPDGRAPARGETGRRKFKRGEAST